MAVTYKKLFKLFIDRDLKKQDLAEKAKISLAKISKMAAVDNVTIEVVKKVCLALEVRSDDFCDSVDEVLILGQLCDYAKVGWSPKLGWLDWHVALPLCHFCKF